ncbi:MAG TPA: alpha/beta fold hydrolase [Actinomycetes bacterium]|nr:alpha/beta fold hydrolase [Actinomycetes bacterium]
MSVTWGEARGNALTDARAFFSPRGLRGAALEVAWSATHLALYPWGVVEGRAQSEIGRFTLANLAPAQRGLVIGDVEAAGTPILLIHGMVDNRSIFALLSHQLRRRGFGRVLSLNYSPLSGDVRRVAHRLAELVEAVCAETGYERIHVIGHSMGGVVGRYYVQRLGGDERVHTLVTLGTPHSGTLAAHLIPHPLGRQLRPGSQVLRELAEPAPGCQTRVVSVWSDLDQLILPKDSAELEHQDLQVRNVLVRGVGHMSLPVDGRVVHEIATTLAHLDPDGSTTRAGVTTLTQRTGSTTAGKGKTRHAR